MSLAWFGHHHPLPFSCLWHSFDVNMCASCRRGDTFEAIPPTLQSAFSQLQQESANDVFTDAAKNLCDSGVFDSMSLDQARPTTPL